MKSGSVLLSASAARWLSGRGLRWGMVLAGLCLPGASQAAESSLEISEPCVAIGCFPGDGPGLPVTITQPGHYVLTSPLVVSGAGSTAIEVQADGVEIDLGGFTLRGPNTCSGVPVTSCSSTGSGAGVAATGAPQATGTAVRNGFVRGFGGTGLALGAVASISDVGISHNGAGGLVVGAGSRVDAVSVRSNLGAGMSLGDGSGATDVIAAENELSGVVLAAGASLRWSSVVTNGGSGVELAGSALVQGCSIAQSGGSGVLASSGGTITENVVRLSGTHGIEATGAQVSRNVSGQNTLDGYSVAESTLADNSGVGNQRHGFSASSGSLVSGNVARSNVDTGMVLSADTGYRSNSISVNTVDALVGGVNLGENYCQGTGASSSTCP